MKNLEQPVKEFIPKLKGAYSNELKLIDLATMSSGLDWQEEYYSPFEITASSYFIDDLSSLILNQKIIEKPGENFKYLSGATQLLGMAIVNATGKSLSDYLYESFWNPMGMENSSLWQIDGGGNRMEKAFCCIASNARDFAKFGKLYKDHGKWNNKILIDSTYVAKSVSPHFKESPEYGYGFWLGKWKEEKIFFMQGHLGQYVFVLPKKNIIIVRLGHQKGEKDTDGHFIYIDEAIKMLNSAN